MYVHAPLGLDRTWRVRISIRVPPLVSMHGRASRPDPIYSLHTVNCSLVPHPALVIGTCTCPCGVIPLGPRTVPPLSGEKEVSRAGPDVGARARIDTRAITCIDTRPSVHTAHHPTYPLHRSPCSRSHPPVPVVQGLALAHCAYMGWVRHVAMRVCVSRRDRNGVSIRGPGVGGARTRSDLLHMAPPACRKKDLTPLSVLRATARCACTVGVGGWSVCVVGGGGGRRSPKNVHPPEASRRAPSAWVTRVVATRVSTL